MIVYLDQNKWIEIARIENGVERSKRAIQFLEEMNAALECGYIFPLSAFHIVEFARIKSIDRRIKLGVIMWKYSQGLTTAPIKELLCHEIENAFSSFGYNVIPRNFNYIGKGIRHAFEKKPDVTYSNVFENIIDEALLCGYEDIPPIEGVNNIYRENFANHLNSLNDTKNELDKSKWDNWLYAISMLDIREPLYEVMSANRIPKSFIETCGEEKLKKFMDSIPNRKLDIHLHRQVLRNPCYKPKFSDLEDWAGLGAAACYSDVVICEKHFADMVKRDSFKTKARVITSIYDLFTEF